MKFYIITGNIAALGLILTAAGCLIYLSFAAWDGWRKMKQRKKDGQGVSMVISRTPWKIKKRKTEGGN